MDDTPTDLLANIANTPENVEQDATTLLAYIELADPDDGLDNITNRHD